MTKTAHSLRLCKENNMKIAENHKIRITTYNVIDSSFKIVEKNVGKYHLATAIEKVTAKYAQAGYELRTNPASLCCVKWVNKNYDCIEIMPGKV